MPLSFPVYLQYPFVMVESGGDTFPYVQGDMLGRWGIITQVNPTSAFGVDNVVFYKTTDVTTLVNPTFPIPKIGKSPENPEIYYFVNEENIVLVQSI